MADDLPIEVAEDPNYPGVKTIGQVSGQPDGGITGLRRVRPLFRPNPSKTNVPGVWAGDGSNPQETVPGVWGGEGATPKTGGSTGAWQPPFRAAAWSDPNKNADGTPKAAPTDDNPIQPVIERYLKPALKPIKDAAIGAWNDYQKDPQGMFDRIRDTVNGPNRERVQPSVPPVPEVTVGPNEDREAAPMAITGDNPFSTGAAKVPNAPAVNPSSPNAPIEKLADILDTERRTNVIKPPAGSLVDKVTKEDTKTNSALPPMATPTAQTTQTGRPAPGLFGVPGLLGALGENIHNWTDQRRMQLMALAGGLASGGGKGFGYNFGKGMTAAAAATPAQNALNNQNATMQALISKGFDPETARAAAGNPHLLQQILPQAFGGKQLDWTEIGTDMSGNKIMGWVDKVHGITYNKNGQIIGNAGGGVGGPHTMDATAGAAGAAGAAAAAGTDAYTLPEGSLAPGVKNFDPTLKGDEFLNQFSPQMRSAIQAYVDGDSKIMNARQKGGVPQAAVRDLAKMYGQNSGIDVRDDTYDVMRKFRLDAQDLGNSKFGGMRLNGNTAMEHLSTLSDVMVQLQNKGYGYVPGLSHLMNTWRQQGTDEQKSIANAFEDAREKYLAEVQKYYSGSNTGGVAEREDTRQRMASNLTPVEFAKLLGVQRDLFAGKLHNLETTRSQAFQGNEERADRLVGPVISPSTKERMAKIQSNIDTLRGNTRPQNAPIAAASPGGASQEVKIVRQGNHHYRIMPDGSAQQID